MVALHGFFNLSTWLTAIAGAAILLLAYHLLTSHSAGRSRSSRSRRWGASVNEQARRVPPAAGIVVVVVGAILMLLGMAGHAVGGRRRYY